MIKPQCQAQGLVYSGGNDVGVASESDTGKQGEESHSLLDVERSLLQRPQPTWPRVRPFSFLGLSFPVEGTSKILLGL